MIGIGFACCSADQRRVLASIAIYVLAIFLLWRVDQLLKPFKLLAVFIHEFSHASACWLTGGSVVGLEVRLNEGGVTRYRGGCQRIVVPAGYLGGAVWGAVGTVACASAAGRLAIVGVLGAALLYTLLGSLFLWRNVEARATTASMALFFLFSLAAAVWLDQFYLPGRDVLLYVLLFLTTFVSVFSVYDIWDDCVRRYVSGSGETSDAVVCARLCPILPARGWGALWFLVALALWAGGVVGVLALVRGRRARPRFFIF